MSPSLHIAWADEEHTDALIPLMLALYDDDPSNKVRPTAETAAEHVAEILAPSNPHRLAVALADDGSAIGLAAVAFILSINEAQPDRRKQMELKELFVLSDHRSRGVGDALMSWVKEKAMAAGVYRMDWHVKETNSRGITFYQRFGGDVVHDRLSMRRLLSGE